MRISDWSSDVCSSDLWNRAFELAQGFDEARGVEDVQAAITALRALPELEGGVGVVGYCLGGKLAYLAATRPDCDVAVGYYGVGIEQKLDEAENQIGRASWRERVGQ